MLFARAYGTSTAGEPPTFSDPIALESPWEWLHAPSFSSNQYYEHCYYVTTVNGIIDNGPYPVGTVVVVNRKRTRGMSVWCSGQQFRFIDSGPYSNMTMTRSVSDWTILTQDVSIGAIPYIVR